MGYGRYELTDGRWGGYLIRTTCEEPGCTKRIDRGLAYCCGDPLVKNRDPESGCGKYLCGEHNEGHNTGDNPRPPRNKSTETKEENEEWGQQE